MRLQTDKTVTDEHRIEETFRLGPSHLLEPLEPLAQDLHKIGASKFFTFGLILQYIAHFGKPHSYYLSLHFLDAPQTFVCQLFATL